MNLSDCLLCLWPGLPKLWLRGQWSSLILAVLFTVALNLAIIRTFLWPDWLSIASTFFLWPILTVVWLGCAMISFRQLPDLILVPVEKSMPKGKPDLLVPAQLAYLQGKFPEAETLLKRQLSSHPEDVAGGILLATLYRHQARFSFAKRQLAKLSQWDVSVRWQFEIDLELERIQQGMEESPEEQEVPTTPSS